MRHPFPPELRTLAFVPRWCVMMTNHRDNVAQHSFFVSVYSYMIAEIIGWKGPRDYLMMNALMHDNDESITGDITGPVKNIVVDIDSEDFLNEKTGERMGLLIDSYYRLEDQQSAAHIQEATDIVMVADKLDALLFLIVNERLGCTTVGPAMEGGLRSLEGAWRKLPAPKELLDEMWQVTVLPTIEAHKTKGGRGVAPGVVI